MKMSVGGMLGDKHMKIKVIVLILSCMLILSICIWFIFGLSSSRREFIVNILILNGVPRQH